MSIHTACEIETIPIKLEQNNIDVILLESGKQGWDLESFNTIKTISKGRPLVIYSRTENKEASLEAITHGAQDYVVSGITAGDSLIQTLRYAIARNNNEKNLIESQNRLKAILHNADAFFSMDGDWCITDWNALAEKTFGWNLNEIQGKNFSLILPTYLRRPFLKRIKEKLSGIPGDVSRVQGEVLATNRSGFEFPISYVIFKIKNDDTYMYCAFVHDITEKRNAKEELENLVQERTVKLTQSNEQLRQFAKIASHDLQEPLRSIQGFVSLLSENIKGKIDSESDEYLDFIENSSKRMQELVKSILQHSEIKTFTDEIFVTDCNSVIEEVVRNLKDTIKETHTHLEIHPLPEVGVERGQMVQLFQNLISNAIKYQSDEKPCIQISAEKIIDKWLFSVRDKSIGIDPSNYNKIFDMFSRLHGGARYPGTGMGLAICKKIVNSYEGSIWVESKLGEGSIFFFTLPTAKKPAEKLDTTEIEILLVEDSPADVKLAQEALRRSGLRYKLNVVNDGLEALNYLQRVKVASGHSLPSIILLDLNMPNMNGHQVLNEIKDDPALKNIPVILLTVSDRAEDIDEALSLKMNYYVPKPVTAKKISTLIKSFHELSMQSSLGLISSCDEETHIKLIMAGNPHTSQHILKQLANDTDEKIRSRIAENVNTPFDVLEKLAQDESSTVRLGVCDNPSCSILLLEKLSQDQSEEVRLGMSENPNCPEALLKILANDENTFVSSAASKTLSSLE
ncbi:MAG: response regulator [Candidatus Melainabacteria bacterium]|nr:response regulator [Candidatus Melainabacteria bacterium]